MGKGNNSKIRVFLLISIGLTLACGIITYFLFDQPVGTIFNTFLHLTLVGLVAYLAATAVISFRRRTGMLIMKIIGSVAAVIAVIVAVVTIIANINYRIIPGTRMKNDLSAEELIPS
ncbi:MAG: hypothetical protein GF417_10480 [Candidatus Latescibacteria bacterium]|nr:hypothetical protein [bacterium]MBD3424853.1 hypothetical protein [Candidatus Latescibacterota bacterium]